MKFKERKLSLTSEKEKNRIFSPAKSYLDQPGHSSNKRTGENHLGSSVTQYNIEQDLYNRIAAVTLNYTGIFNRGLGFRSPLE